jgi:hypothetical protein
MVRPGRNDTLEIWIGESELLLLESALLLLTVLKMLVYRNRSTVYIYRGVAEGSLYSRLFDFTNGDNNIMPCGLRDKDHSKVLL